MTTQQILNNNLNATGAISSLYRGEYNRLYDIFAGEVPIPDSMDFALTVSFYTLDLYSTEIPDDDEFARLKEQVRPLCLVWLSTNQIVADKVTIDKGRQTQRVRYRWYVDPQHKDELVQIGREFHLRINHGLAENVQAA